MAAIATTAPISSPTAATTALISSSTIATDRLNRLNSLDRAFMMSVMDDLNSFMESVRRLRSVPLLEDFMENLMGSVMDMVIQARHHLMAGMVVHLNDWMSMHTAVFNPHQSDDPAVEKYRILLLESELTKIELMCIQWTLKHTINQLVTATNDGLSPGTPGSLTPYEELIADLLGRSAYVPVKVLKKYYGMVDNPFHRMVRPPGSAVRFDAKMDTDSPDQEFLKKVLPQLDQFFAREPAAQRLTDGQRAATRVRFIEMIVRAREHLMAGMGVPFSDWRIALKVLLPANVVPTTISATHTHYRALTKGMNGDERLCLVWALLYTINETSVNGPDEQLRQYLTNDAARTAQVMQTMAPHHKMSTNVFHRMVGH